MSLSACDTCYSLTAQSCTQYLVLQTGVDDGGYYVFINDVHGKDYIQYQSSSSGQIIVDLSMFDRTFTSSSGKFMVTVSTDSDTNTAEALTIGGQTYNCIVISFADSVLTND